MFAISKVLIVEKDTGESELIKGRLQRQGMETELVSGGIQALESIQRQTYDKEPFNSNIVAVLFSSSFTLREAFTEYSGLRTVSKIPVFIQVDPFENRRRMRDLQRQFSVYFVESGNIDHLVRKLNYLAESCGEPRSPIRIGGLELLPQGRKLLCDGQEVHLTPREFALLRCMMQTPDTAFTNNQLLYLVWGSSDDSFAHSLHTHITSLRSKLGPYRTCIVSVRKVGYLFRSTNLTL